MQTLVRGKIEEVTRICVYVWRSFLPVNNPLAPPLTGGHLLPPAPRLAVPLLHPLKASCPLTGGLWWKKNAENGDLFRNYLTRTTPSTTTVHIVILTMHRYRSKLLTEYIRRFFFKRAQLSPDMGKGQRSRMGTLVTP